MSNLFTPFGYTMSELSTMGAANLGSGALCAFLVGVFLDQTGWYRRTHLTLSFGGVLCVSYFFIALPYELSIFPSVLLSGMIFISYHPMSYSYGAEMTFPT